MLNYLQHAAKLNRGYLGELVADIEQAEMVEQPQPGMNHPAWILAHLTVSAGHVVSLLGGSPPVPEGWNERFGHGSKLSADPADFPDKQTLLEAYQASHQAMVESLGSATDEALAAPVPIEELREMMPTVGDAVFFMATAHEASHLGQLSAWRRAKGRAPLF